MTVRTKKVVGYTTGVFDLFHIGHLRLLKKAKRHCDYLIVGVSSDELVFKYKNKAPVIPFKDRLEIVSSLGIVDEVVVQSHRDKIRQYHEIQYDLLFVGDDWKGSDIFSNLEVELARFGASVIYFEYTKEVSSTKFTELLGQLFENEGVHQ